MVITTVFDKEFTKLREKAFHTIGLAVEYGKEQEDAYYFSIMIKDVLLYSYTRKNGKWKKKSFY